MDEKVKIVEVPDISKGLDKYLEKKKDKQEVCDHKGGSHISYFTHQGIERKGQYCNKCDLLLDYWPQYGEDEL